MTTPAGFDEPHTYLVALTTPDDHLVATIDLDYSLAIDHEGTAVEGVAVYPIPTGAELRVDDPDAQAIYLLSAAECIRLAHYLLACASAAADRQAKS
jgi:hypothetical protein